MPERRSDVTDTRPKFLSLRDYALHFTANAPAPLRAWVDGGAAEGHTVRANEAAFQRIGLWPRVLQDLHGASTALRLFGSTLKAPFLIAPTACHGLLHPEGEYATATAAALTGCPMVVSTQASVRLEDLKATVPQADLWFQIYPQATFADTLDLCRRAQDAGYSALVVTVDAPVSGIRNHEQHAGFAYPPGSMANLTGYAPAPEIPGPQSPVFRGLLDPALRWHDIATIRQNCSVPLWLKGILHPEDALRARDIGADGIIVSNHGGRVLDTVPATIEALPAIRQRLGSGFPILLDGGIRRGTDVITALALGADAVLLGRPILHALFASGMPGVAHALTLLHTETETAMALIGAARCKDIGRAHLFGLIP